MTAIYLDTSHLAVLSRARAAAESSYATFLAMWRATPRELVFTRTHLVELRRHNDPLVREQRYSLLEDLLPISSDIVTREPVPQQPVLTPTREVLRALSEKNVFAAKSSDDAALDEWHRTHLEILPERWTDVSDVNAARSFEHISFGKIVHFMQHAAKSEASALKRPASQAYERPRVRDLQDTPISEEQTKLALETFERVYSSDAEIAALFPFLPVADARDLLRRQTQPLRDMVLRAGQVGIGQAYLETMGSVVDPTDKRHLDDVLNELLFRHYVRNALEILGVSTDRQEVIGRRVSVDDCPGFWLARAVHLETGRAEPEPAASNSYDMDHVLYAPYVDAFFTDKRIASYINAIRRRGTPPVRVSQMATAVSTAADVIAIISAIQAVSTT